MVGWVQGRAAQQKGTAKEKQSVTGQTFSSLPLNPVYTASLLLGATHIPGEASRYPHPEPG